MRHEVPSYAVIVSGGVAHDFEASSAALAQVLTEASYDVEVTSDVEAALLDLADHPTPPLLVLNLLRWSMNVARYAHLRERWSLTLTPAARAAVVTHLERGGGVLAMHGASICFDDWPQWQRILGGTWNWERSSHPPLDETPVTVRVDGAAHPVVAGVEDFPVIDEVYGFLDLQPDVRALMSSAHGEAEHPLLWAREVLGGRVVYDALGHDARSYEAPAHRLIVQRAALWASRSLGDGEGPDPT